MGKPEKIYTISELLKMAENRTERSPNYSWAQRFKQSFSPSDSTILIKGKMEDIERALFDSRGFTVSFMVSDETGKIQVRYDMTRPQLEYPLLEKSLKVLLWGKLIVESDQYYVDAHRIRTDLVR